eukprot:534683-Pelagomonas_calceolata.AAC.1
METHMQEQDRMTAELREAHSIALDSAMRKREREQSLMASFESLSSRIGAAEREKEELARKLGNGGCNMHGHVIMGSNPETQVSREATLREYRRQLETVTVPAVNVKGNIQPVKPWTMRYCEWRHAGVFLRDCKTYALASKQ